MILPLIVASLILTFASGVPGALMKAGRPVAQKMATALHIIGCAAGVAAALSAVAGGGEQAAFSWPLPGGVIAIRLDALSAFFLLPLYVVTAAGSLFGEGYWPEIANQATGRKLRFFYGTLTAGLTLVMIAGDAWLFLAGWEITGLSAFFLVTTESDSKEALRAGWIYLIATHAATLVLFAMFGAFHNATGSWLLRAGLLHNPAMAAPILALGLVAFGIKAGVMPGHVWLPEAHAAAPSHVSAVLSGVVLKMGVYGLVRIMTLLPLNRGFGLALLFAGITSGILGVVFALAQHDLKRLLAYHSIENIGIIFIGLGTAVLGRSEPWAALAMAGALLHVWNHALFKALLFFAAGSVVHATGTRSMDLLGGLFASRRAAGLSFLVGAVAICGLPPLNGFVSEWLIYAAGFNAAITGGGGIAIAAIFATPALALIGALAAACFVKAFSVVFLGSPRSSRTFHGQKEPPSMKIAMGLLALLCIVIGVWPMAVNGALARGTADALGHDAGVGQIRTLFSTLPLASAAALVAMAAAAAVIAAGIRRSRKSVTWDCGYTAPTSRMQYTASSLASPFVELFRWALRPDIHTAGQQTLFPSGGSFSSHVPDPVLDRFLVPGISRGKRLLSFVYFIQAGRIQVYILYVVATLLILLAWSAT